MNLIEALKKYERVRQDDWVPNIWLEMNGPYLHKYHTGIDYGRFDFYITYLLADNWVAYIGNCDKGKSEDFPWMFGNRETE